MMASSGTKPGIAVLISGEGTNLQALIDAINSGDIPARILGVISDKPGAAGLERAREAGIPTQVIERPRFASREAYDLALLAALEEMEPELIVLAGFMRILGAELTRRFHGRMLNVHPSLLPDFPGLHTYRRALEQNVDTHGASVHFVTEELDGGPVVIKAEVPVFAHDDERSLAQRTQSREHIIYPLAVRWYAQGRLRLRGDQVCLDGEPLESPPVLAWDEGDTKQ